MTKTAATKKPESLPEFPAKKQENMNEVLQAIRPIPTVEPGRFGLAQHARNIFHYHAAAGTELKDYLVAAFWVPEAAKLSPLCRIEIVEECGLWFGEVMVRSISGSGVDLMLLSYVKIGGVAPVGAKAELKDGLRVEFRGRHLLWCVIDQDQQLISHIPTEIAAINWMETNDHPPRPTA